MTFEAGERDGQKEPAIEVLAPMRELSSVDKINHRIANSLQLLSAIVSAEGQGINDPWALAALENTRRRISAIAGVHRLLCVTDGAATTGLSGYLKDLARGLDESYAAPPLGRHIYVEADEVLVSPDHATSIGIIVSELVTNACKYAYAPDAADDVRISLTTISDRECRLLVEDSGTGRSAPGSTRTPGLGTRLIDMMTARVGGSYAWEDASPGTRFVLNIPRQWNS